MSQFSFPDLEKESEFQEILLKTIGEHPYFRDMNEDDLRIIFAAGQEFEGGRIKKKFGICSLGDE